MGRFGAASANHPLAAAAGLDILRAGGNAFDAAVATALTLGVAEPMMSGLGGDGIYHAYSSAVSSSHIFNGTGAAPRAATPDRFSKSGLPLRGPLSVSTPGALAGLGAMHNKLGRLHWSRLFQAAIAHARDGFAVTHIYCRFLSETKPLLTAKGRKGAPFLHAHSPGMLLLQPALARTLEEIASDGAETFYRGRLAARLVAALQETGPLVQAADLEACTAEIQSPIAIDYRGFSVTQTPPNSVGFTLLQMLKIAECFDIAAMDPVERMHVLIEAKKRAFLDLERHGGDSRFHDAPLQHLLSTDYAAEQAASIDPGYAADIKLADPEAADGDTTYFCIIDAEGNAVSGIQSLNSAFGSGVIAGDTGILLNNRMAYWHLAQGHANRLTPGKRVRHTMNAPKARPGATTRSRLTSRFSRR
jgi:gamma-glutamyltranspeptidase/glutathione hydrolase